MTKPHISVTSLSFGRSRSETGSRKQATAVRLDLVLEQSSACHFTLNFGLIPDGLTPRSWRGTSGRTALSGSTIMLASNCFRLLTISLRVTP
jgi:hypothetical protein